MGKVRSNWNKTTRGRKEKKEKILEIMNVIKCTDKLGRDQQKAQYMQGTIRYERYNWTLISCILFIMGRGRGEVMGD